MHAVTDIPRSNRRIEIAISGVIDSKNVRGILKDAMVELFCGNCEEFVLDMRRSNFVDDMVLYRFYSLLQVFTKTVVQKKVHITILYNDLDQRRVFLAQATEFSALQSGVSQDCEEVEQVLEQEMADRMATVH
jgi:hypothetical protein